jgi:hypothetical protein
MATALPFPPFPLLWMWSGSWWFANSYVLSCLHRIQKLLHFTRCGTRYGIENQVIGSFPSESNVIIIAALFVYVLHDLKHLRSLFDHRPVSLYRSGLLALLFGTRRLVQEFEKWGESTFWHLQTSYHFAAFWNVGISFFESSIQVAGGIIWEFPITTALKIMLP